MFKFSTTTCSSVRSFEMLADFHFLLIKWLILSFLKSVFKKKKRTLETSLMNAMFAKKFHNRVMSKRRSE